MKKYLATIIMFVGMVNINAATLQGNEFSYQGELKDSSNNLLTGLYDFQFILYEESTATNIITDGIDDADITIESIQVTNGLFTVLLDFPIPVFLGDQVWMKIHVKLNGSVDPLTPLSPLQQITSAPYALYAVTVPVNSISNVEIDSNTVQTRIDGSCAVGEAISLVNADGSVNCIVGPTGATGDQGPQGPAGAPQTSIDGLAGGTVTGGTTIDGDLTVTGNISINGSTLGYPINPTMVVGHETPGCIDLNASQFYSTIQFPINFDTPPFFQLTIDETLNNSGAVQSHLYKWDRNEVSVRCSALSDGGFWMAMDFGSHTISGKKIVVGRETNVITNTLISFGEFFSTPPVVLLYPDDSVGTNNSSDLRVRIINNVTTSGFQVWTNATLEGLHWVAMEAGEYTHGRYHWAAGIGTNATNGAAFNFATITPGMVFTTRPRVMTTIHDTNNSGGSQTRVRQVDRDGFEIFINSTSEFMHYIAIEDLR